MLVTLPSGHAALTPIADPITWADLGPATPGWVLAAADLEYMVSAAVAYHRRPAFFRGTAGSQSIPASAWTAIGLGEDIDIHSGHSDSANPSRVAADQTHSGADWYVCIGMVPVAAAASGAVIAGIRLNGGNVYEGGKVPLGSGHAATAMVCDLLRVATGTSQYVELMAYQNSGGALATQSSGGKVPQFGMRWACSDAGDVVSAPATPRTWTADDLITADLTGTNRVPLNVHIGDVVRWLRYPPVARLDSRTTTQTIPSGAWTSIQFPFESIDNYSGHDNSVNNSRYTCQRAGLYFVYGLASLSEAGTTGQRVARLLVNGTTAYAGTSATPVSGSTIGSSLACTAHIRLNVGDYVELQSYQSQGSALAVKTGTGDASRLICVWRSL